MTTKDEALKLAREALESCSAGDYSTGHVIHPSFDVDAVNKAIDAVDEALAQPEQEQFALKHRIAELEGAVIGLQARLAQPYPDNFIDALKFDVAKRDSEAQQAYEDAFVNGTGVMLGDKRIDPASIYKEPEQEPVAWMLSGNVITHAPDAAWTNPSAWTPLYTTPPPRKPLTDDDKWKLWVDARSNVLQFARTIEAAHGITGEKA